MSNQGLEPASTHPDHEACVSTHLEAHTLGADLAASAATVLKAVADPLRLRMLALIASAPAGEACVCDLTELADVSGPTVSHHLKTLRSAGLVESERRGTWVYYRVATVYAATVRALLDSLVPAAGTEETGPAIALENVDRPLADTARELQDRFPEFAPAVVERVVRESYTALARRAAVRQHLLPLARRFATQRLDDLRRAQRPGSGLAPQVLFVCVQNAGRSQLAAALLRHYAGDAIVVRSAGSMPAAGVHASVRAHLEALGGDDAFPKPLTDDAVRAADVVITMGCGDVCPIYEGTRYEDWRVGDPALASPAGVDAIVADLDARVRALIHDLLPDLDLRKA